MTETEPPRPAAASIVETRGRLAISPPELRKSGFFKKEDRGDLQQITGDPRFWKSREENVELGFLGFKGR